MIKTILHSCTALSLILLATPSYSQTKNVLNEVSNQSIPMVAQQYYVDQYGRIIQPVQIYQQSTLPYTYGPNIYQRSGGSSGGGLAILAGIGLLVALAGSGNDDGGGNGGGDGDGGGGGDGTNKYDPIYTGNLSYGEEYRMSPDLDRLNPSGFYASGYDGTGVIISILDTGIDEAHKDLSGGVRRDLSWNYLTTNRDLNDRHGHGTHVASIIGARNNGYGTLGVAYGADLMSVNIIHPIDQYGNYQHQSLSTMGNGFIRSTSAGASVLNNSWAFNQSIANFGSIQDAINGGVLNNDLLSGYRSVIQHDAIAVFAAGNNGQSEVDVAAGMPLLDPTLEGHWVAVVSVDSNDSISSFSNRCGSAMNFCIAAPGEDILAAKSGDANLPPSPESLEHTRMSGTSMAAPHVSGALGVLRSAFPELSSPDILNILFDTARDLGTPGIDAIYGHGMLDLQNAMTPQGEITIAIGDEIGKREISINESYIDIGYGVSTALASSLKDTELMVMDKYDRGFKTNVANFVAQTKSSSQVARSLSGFNPTSQDKLIFLDNGYSLEITSASGMKFNMENGSGKTTLTTKGNLGDAFIREEDKKFANSVVFATPHLEIMNTKAGIKHSEKISEKVSLSLGYFTGESASGVESDAIAQTLGLAVSGSGFDLDISLGKINEKGTTLGAVSAGAFNIGDAKTSTDYISLGSRFDLTDQTTLHVSGSFGSTNFSQSGLITGGRNIKTESFAVGISQQDVFGNNDVLSIAVSQPVSVKSGYIDFDMPVGRGASVDGATSQTIERKVFTQNLNNAYDAPLELQIGYKKQMNNLENAEFGFGTVYRNDGANQDISAKFGFQIKF